MSENTLTRRDFIKAAGAVSAGLALSTCPSLPLAAADDEQFHSPNILFIISDDQSFPHAGAYGDKIVKTPNFDKIAREGVLFNNSYCAAPTCTASRGGVLTGQAIHRLAEGGNLFGFLPSRFKVYPDILESVGYFVGYAHKGLGPGTIEGSGRTRNAAGPVYKDFDVFLQQTPKEKPFCFWFGSDLC